MVAAGIPVSMIGSSFLQEQTKVDCPKSDEAIK